MDEQQMDRLTRGFARVVDRRTGVRGLLALGAATLGLAISGREESTAKARKPQGKTKGQKGRVTAQGPCGDGGGKANACTKDSQCCTGSCDKKKGRCRCRKVNQSCRETRQCCASTGQPMTCQSGTCQSVPVAALPPPPPGCGKDGSTCALYDDCCEGFACEGTGGSKVCKPNICAHTCLAADNFCGVPAVSQCCDGKSGCRCMTTNNGPFCFGGAGHGGCEGTPMPGKPGMQVPHCEVDADCEADFGANSGVQCIAASTLPTDSKCCEGVNQSACVLPCPKD